MEDRITSIAKTTGNILFELTRGNVRSQLLLTAIELQLFDQLSFPVSGEDVAAQMKTHPTNTKYLLDGITSLGLITKTNGLYQNTDESEKTLNTQSDVYLGGLTKEIDAWRKETVDDLTKLVRSGPESQSKCSHIKDPDTWRHFVRSIANYQRAGFAHDMADIVSQIKEFPRFKKMLDLGGGPGLVCLAMVDKHPSMEGVIFDQPVVSEVANEYVIQNQMQERVHVMAGDYTKDDIGQGYDLIWASATLGFAKDGIEELLAKIYNALAPGGIFISLSEGMTDEGTAPEPLFMDCMAYMMSGQDFFFQQGEIRKNLYKVGFDSVESNTIFTPMVPMDMDIARKI